MKAHEINSRNNEIIELVSDDSIDFDIKVQPPIEAILRYEVSMDRFILQVDGKTLPVRGRDERNQDLLNKIGEKKLPNISWLAGIFTGSKNQSTLILQVTEFPILQSWGDDIFQFGIDEKIVEQARSKYFKRLIGPNQVAEWLANETIIDPCSEGTYQRLIISVGSEMESGTQTAFRVHGRFIDIDIRTQEDGKLRVERIIFSRSSNRQEKNPLFLVQGKFSFCDISVAGVFKEVRKNEVDRLVERADSYLKLWRDYNLIEREHIINRAKRFGYHTYSNPIQLSNGVWRFNLYSSERLQNALLELDRMETPEMEVSSLPPDELVEPGQFDINSKPIHSSVSSQNQVFIGELVGSDPNRFTIDLRPPLSKEDVIPPDKGVVYLALTGDRTRLDRRNDAEVRIRSMGGPMPQLVFILEGLGVPSGRRKNEKPFSPSAVERFKGTPTQVQMDAIDIALNTPDIALIQGPPGTGKTRVIAALEVRLAEINKERDIPGKTLLTSYQHDAVANAAAQTIVFGLPAVKIGTKKDQSEVDDGVEPWRKERIEWLESDLSKLPDKPASQVYRQVKNLVIGYRKAPMPPAQTAELLGRISDLSADYVTPILRDQLRNLKTSLARGYTLVDDDQKEERDRALKALFDLRTQPHAFLDDGDRFAKKALYFLMKLNCLSSSEQELFELAANWDQNEAPPFLSELETLKNKLIDNLEEKTRLAGLPLENEDVSNFLNLWCDSLFNNLRDSTQGIDSVVSDYLDDLINDPDGIRFGILDYSSVLAATCQQSASKQMQNLKEKDPFESVLIDEAARANPLDLFIPMSLAERRIILVGDHRQLPQILEPEVEKLLEQSVQEQTQKAIRKSLFERLFEQLKNTEDGITRTITLNVQYRMHRVLGDFVSQVFYEPFGEGFSSGKPDEEFIHHNPLFKDKVAGWVNLPLDRGAERGGRSKYRSIEAEWIANNIKTFMDADPDFTVGIITFYSAQVREILKKMSEGDIVEQLENGSYQVKPAYASRLQVNTVDAFQGKEFDVVILSITRSNDIPVISNKDLRKKFGFLLLSNRLCVAMSRQKRLLVAVGDASMFSDKTAEESVPGLIEFKKLCEGPYGKIL